MVDLLDGAVQCGRAAIKAERNLPLQNLNAVFWQWWIYTKDLDKNDA